MPSRCEGDLNMLRRGLASRRFTAAWAALSAAAFVAGAIAAETGSSAPLGSSSDEQSATVGFELGSSERFRQLNRANGSLTTTADQVYEGQRSAKATYDGGGSNGYARGLFHVAWDEGDTVTYGAAFYFPSGFRDSMQGPVSLMRWDNWPSNSGGGDIGGLIILQADERIHLVQGGYDRGYEGDLLDLPLTEGRWVHLEVRQRLDTGANALTELYVDGQLVQSSTAPNMSGRRIERLRFGLVSMAAGAQLDPLTLYFDRVSHGTTLHGPR